MKNTYLAPFTFIISSPIKNRPSLLKKKQMFSHCHRPSLVSVPMQLISYCVICARIRALLRGKLTPDSGTFMKCTYLVKPCMVYHSMYSMPDQTNIVHIFKCASPSPLHYIGEHHPSAGSNILQVGISTKKSVTSS